MQVAKESDAQLADIHALLRSKTQTDKALARFTRAEDRRDKQLFGASRAAQNLEEADDDIDDGGGASAAARAVLARKQVAHHQATESAAEMLVLDAEVAFIVGELGGLSQWPLAPADLPQAPDDESAWGKLRVFMHDSREPEQRVAEFLRSRFPALVVRNSGRSAPSDVVLWLVKQAVVCSDYVRADAFACLAATLAGAPRLVDAWPPGRVVEQSEVKASTPALKLRPRDFCQLLKWCGVNTSAGSIPTYSETERTGPHRASAVEIVAQVRRVAAVLAILELFVAFGAVAWSDGQSGTGNDGDAIADLVIELMLLCKDPSLPENIRFQGPGLPGAPGAVPPTPQSALLAVINAAPSDVWLENSTVVSKVFSGCLRNLHGAAERGKFDDLREPSAERALYVTSSFLSILQPLAIASATSSRFCRLGAVRALRDQALGFASLFRSVQGQGLGVEDVTDGAVVSLCKLIADGIFRNLMQMQRNVTGNQRHTVGMELRQLTVATQFLGVFFAGMGQPGRDLRPAVEDVYEVLNDSLSRMPKESQYGQLLKLLNSRLSTIHRCFRAFQKRADTLATQGTLGSFMQPRPAPTATDLASF